MSSILSNIQLLSIAVLITCLFTINGSQTFASLMSAMTPLLPSIPHVQRESPDACFARNAVNNRMGEPPQFSINVRGITSNACATALNGNCWTPSMDLDFTVNAYKKQKGYIYMFVWETARDGCS